VTTLRALVLVLGSFVVAGCGGHHGGGGGADGGLAYGSIDVEPAQATVALTLGGTASQTYQVFGVNGSKKTDITASCQLAIDPTFGTFQGATATVAGRGGKPAVTASCNGQTGAAELVVTLSGSLVVGTNTPAGAPGLFGGATAGTDPARAPVLEYPLDNAVSPLNLPPIEIQWQAAGNDLFHIALASTYASVDVYTSDVQATLSETDWAAVAGTAAGDTQTITIEGLLQSAPQQKFASAADHLVMSTDTIDRSAIYYWASSKGDVMNQTFGETTPPSVVEGDCTACHSVSHSGTRIGYSRCVANDCSAEYVGFLKFDPNAGTWNEVINANDKAIAGTYTTFAPLGNPFPDDTQAVAMVTRGNGTLALYDPDTGAAVASNLDATANQAGRSSLMPVWSPDGSQVVFASTPHAGESVDLVDSQIAIMTYQYSGGQHVFGTPQVIVPGPIALPGGSYTNLFFPSFSPDGAYIALDAARGSWRNFTDAKTAGQRLMLTDPTGSRLIDLTALNGGNVDADITWPHWAPGATSDYYWVVFSSERDYGHEVTAANTAAPCVANGVKQCKQLWIGAISKAVLAAGGTADPSAPPMWLPGQDTQADNISPYWAVPATIQ
jgi:hypothetical protein